MRILARKSLAVLLSFAVVVSMLPGLTLTAHADAYSWQGDGSKNSPYLVSGQADLLEMQTSGETYAGKYFKVTDNITVTDENFTGIGESSSLKQFKGYFDGGDKTITLGIEVGTYNVGLFGYLGSGAVVENVTVAGSVTGNYNVGGIAGFNNGATIRNCISEAVIMSSNASSGTAGVGGIAGNMTGGTIEKCTNKGDLIAGFTSTTGVSTTSFGGIVGAIQSTKGNVVSECRNEGNIDSHAIDEDGNGVPDTDEAGNLKTEAGIPSTAGVAGIVGKVATVAASIEDCSNSGNVCATGTNGNSGGGVAGIIGYIGGSGSSVERCSNTGKITGITANTSHTGGIAGYVYATSVISQSYNLGDVTAAGGAVGGIAARTYAYASAVTIQSCYNGGNVSNTKSGAASSSYNAFAAGIVGQPGKSDVTVKNSYSYGNVSNTATGSYAYAGGIIGKASSTSINAAYINDNTYLTDTAAKGIGNVTNDAEGYEASEKTDILGVVGSDYQADLTDNINGGFPILRWQNADALYSLTFNVTDKEMSKSLTDAAVTVKNGDAVQNPQADGSYELAPGTYSYEVSRPGYAAEKGDVTLKKSSKTEAVALTSVKHDYVVKVAPADADLTIANENAPKIGEPEKTVSEEDNTATYTYSLADEQAYGAYSYSLSRYGYDRASGELKATGTDDETSVTMTKAATHKFTVKVTPENAKVTLVNTEYGVTVEADSAEGGVWTYSLIPGAYTYKVKASGYTTVADSVTIEDSDSNESVELEEKACWDGTSIDTDWYNDKDTSFDISEPEELAGFAKLVNDGKTFAGKTVNLTKDIDLGSKHWTSIGNNSKKFSGTFNGNGHAVKNLYINITGTAGAANGYRGLFGQTDSAAISSLKLDNVLIEAKTTTSYQYVGSLVGKATKTDISDITVSGKIDLSKKPGSYTGGVTGQTAGGSMIDCINNAEISSGYQVAGITGTTGSNPTVIKRCVNNGAITGIYSGTTKAYAVAGIVGNLGAAKDEVLYCINNGDISGADQSMAGIAGQTTKAVRIINSYNTGAVKSTNAKSYVGGIIAYIDNSYTSNTPTIQNCYNIGKLAIDAEAATKEIGGVVGKQSSSTINNAYFTNNYYEANDSYKGTRYTDSFDAEGAFEAFDDTFGADTLGSAYGADVKDGDAYKYNGGYPILRWQNPDSLYDISFAPKYDNKYNLAENSSIEVLVKNSAGEDIKVTGETAQLKNGEYTYTVKQKGYKDVTGSLTVDRESFEQEVSFEAIKYAYAFVIEEGSDLDLVMITEDGEENIKIDRPEYADGKYTYELYNGTYEYTANKMGKGSESGQITVSYEGGEKEITLKAKDAATVTFTVTAKEGSFKDKDPVVSIYNNDENDYYQGDLLGEYDSESDISKGLMFPVGNYTYKIKADGFATVTGDFEVAKDKNVEITKELEIKTGWGGAEDIDTDWYTNYPDASEYTIANEAQLAGLAKLVNDGETFEKKTVKLARDMNLADNTWTPIGGFDQMGGKKPFSGTFDGQGHSIIIRSGNFAKSETSFGVFGYLSDATVRDLTVQGNAKVDYTDEEARFIMAQVGAVSGYALNSTLENCSNQMTFDVSITNEAGTASVNIGGLVGWSVGTSYSKCNNIAAVIGSVKGVGTVICQAGGIAGFNNSGTTGAKSVTSNCYNTGEINATASSGSNETCYSGGLFGNLSAAYLNMTNCYNAADAKASGKTAKTGALAGNATNTTGANVLFFNNYYLDNGLAEPTPEAEKRTDTQMRLIDFVRELGGAYSLNDNGGYPILDWESSVDHIKVTTDPEKLVYNDLEDFDDAGMKITAYMGSDDTDGKEIVSGWTVLNGKSLKAGQETVTVEYKGATVDVPITVNQIVHTIDAGELVFDITAPKAGDTPQTALESGSDKFSAAISWTKGGKAFTGDFEEGAYYRAEVTLTSVYEAGNIYWEFDKNSVPAVDSAYELKNIKFTDSVEDENNANNVMTFTVTFKATSSASGLTDKVSHLYYEGDDSTFVKFGEYLDNTLAIEGGIEKTYTVRELEQLALDSKIGMEGEFGEYSLAGIRLYDLLLENGLSQNTADDTAVYIYGKDRKPVETTIGALRSATGKNAVVIAYGDVANGMPLGSAHGPLWAVQKDAAGIWCANVSRIVIGEIKEADKYNVTFTTDPEGADILVKDAYGNEVASSGNNVYSLRNGEKYSYTVSKEGYSVESGEITLDGADQTIEVSLRTVWDGKTLKKPAQDEYGFYLIGTAEELMWWNQHYGEEGVSNNVRLTADITLNNGKDYINEWKVLGTNSGYSSGGTPAFSGTFDGDGHVIRGLYVNRENTIEYWLFWDGSVGMLADRISELGMFAYTGGDAVIQNLGVEGIIEVFDRPDSMYADWIQIGGIAGLAQGNTKIKNCYTNVGIKAVASTETGLTGGYPHSGWGKACDIYAGGIAGSLSGTAAVENCYSKGTIIGAETRQVTAGGIVGGLRTETTSVENCYSTMSIQSNPLENPNWDSYVGGIVGNASYGDTLGHGSVKGTVALNRNIKGNNTEDITAARVAGKGDTDKLTGNLGLSSMMMDGVNVDNTDILNGKLIKQSEAELAETYTACGWSEDVWTLGGYPMLKWQKTPAGEDITVDYGGQEQEDNTDWDGYFGESAPPPYFNVYFKVDGYDSVLAKSFTKEQMMQMAASDNEGTLYYSSIGYGYAGRAVKEYVYLDTLLKNADVTFASGDWLEYGSYYTGKNDMYTYDSLMADRYYYPEWTSGSSENAEKIKPAIALKSYGASSGVTKELWNYYALQADYLYAYMLVFGQKTPEDMTYTYFTYQQVEGTVTYDDEAAANTTVKNWLTSVISQAQADYDATYESADGTDVPGGYKYVSPEQKEKYKAEIAKAADALNDAEATNGSIMSAGNALEKTMKAFNKIKQDGLGKNRTKLDSAIKLAESIIGKTVASEDGSEINEDQLWAPQAEIDKLNDLIAEARGVLNDTDASQTEIDDAAFKLISAVEDFSSNKGKLEDIARDEAENMLRDYVGSYIDRSKYRDKELAEIDRILEEGIKKIEEAKTVNNIKFALDDAMEAIKSVKTELEAEKAEAKEALSDYFYSIVDGYDASQQVVLREALTQGCEKIDKAVTVEDVKGLVASGKAAMDRISKKAPSIEGGGGTVTPGQQPTEAEKALEAAREKALDELQSWYEKNSQYYEKEQAELAAAVLEGVKAIREAKDASAVTKALDSAVDKIRLIKTKEQIDSEKTKAEELIKQAKAEAVKTTKALKVTTKSTKTAKGNIKVIAKANVSELKAAGFTVKYKFYRSTKKTSGYKMKKTTAKSTYINTSAKKGRKYYYKTKLAIYYKGELIAQTTLKQSTRAARRK